MSVAERALMESENADYVEGEFSLPVTLYGPDGNTYPLSATIFRNARSERPTDDGVIVRETIVVLRITSAPTRLTTGALIGDKWAIYMPVDALGQNYAWYALDSSRASMFDDTLGHVRLYPTKLIQTPVKS